MTSLVDESPMQEQLASAKIVLRENQETLGVDAKRTAISGKWVLVPGGDGEANLAAFDAATESLGLVWVEAPC